MIDDSILRRDLHGLYRPTAAAAGLPGYAYTDPDFFALERERIFKNGWFCIGVAEDAPKRGDSFPVDFLDMPLVMVRGQDDKLRVFHNICSHRGVKLVPKACSKNRRLVCPYHSWAYGLDGELIKTPHFNGHNKHELDGRDAKDLSLKPVRSEIWNHLVFVNISGDAPDLAFFLGPVRERWKDYDFSALEHMGKSIPFQFRANWKLVIENYVESYHVPSIHPDLNTYSRIDDHYQITSDGYYMGQGSAVYTPRNKHANALPPLPGLTEQHQGKGEYLALFPNVMMGRLWDHIYANIVIPVAPDRTEERLEHFFVGTAATDPALAAARQEVIDRRCHINVEDIDVVERLQVGRSSPGFTGGIFSPLLEDTVHQFQRLVAASLLPSETLRGRMTATS